ncbi:GNAT family N-acetyltransferase [Thalassiella azotivora]
MQNALTGVRLVDARYDDDLGSPLVAEIQADLVVRYGGPDETPVDPDEFTPPTGAFLVLLRDDDPAGCVALRRHDGGPGEPAQVELKRMYVRAAHRRQGLARLLLAAAEQRARDLGYTRLLLETGQQQPEAIALYESAGYQAVPGFGHYSCSPLSRSYAKDL